MKKLFGFLTVLAIIGAIAYFLRGGADDDEFLDEELA